MKKLIQTPPKSFSRYSSSFPIFRRKRKKNTLLIKPSFKFDPKGDLDFHPYILFIDQAIRNLIPKDLIASLRTAKNPVDARKIILRINTILPLLTWPKDNHESSLFNVSMICPADYTHGVGRYLTDTLSRWLLPGKFLGVCSVQSLNFQFVDYQQQKFFFHQVILEVNNEEDLVRIKNNISELAQKIRINILGVEHSRRMIASSKFSIEQKAFLVQEKISSLLDWTAQDCDHNAFDQLHSFLFKLLSEEKIVEIRENFTKYIDQKSKIFDRDMFNEIQQFVSLLRDPFTATHDFHHISRLVFFQYIFRKSIQRDLALDPSKRLLSLKFFKTDVLQPMSNKSVLGILIGISLSSENEIFEERHIFQALQRCLFSIRKVKDSYIVDRRPNDKICLFYLEIEKEDGGSFNLDEMKRLRKKLARELKEGVENVIHPVFMPRNEEEVMRNIVLLSQQLKYVSDIPQVMISFEAQSQVELSFTVILVRLLSEKSVSLMDIFHRSKSFLKFHDLETQKVGSLRKKYIKEANVFRISLNKELFLRKDYSLDLVKARQTVSAELSQILGEIRDFNGGILSKQHEVFLQLRESLPGLSESNEFLLENFFYSLTPPIMQSILPCSLLKTLFLMLLEVVEQDFKNERVFFKAHLEGEHLLIITASPIHSYKEFIFKTIDELKISADHAFACVHVDEIPCLAYIFRCENEQIGYLLKNLLKESIDGMRTASSFSEKTF
ncbi:MAG TPA: hypothetical protein VLG49_03585 [Rhabdochlamydiaceae bacterium]|nr:hypothetical protein [Rhabdochlamydiaceae bacterium]